LLLRLSSTQLWKNFEAYKAHQTSNNVVWLLFVRTPLIHLINAFKPSQAFNIAFNIALLDLNSSSVFLLSNLALEATLSMSQIPLNLTKKCYLSSVFLSIPLSRYKPALISTREQSF
jgi:hypothetical protein